MPTFKDDPIICNTTSTQAAIRAVSENHTPQAGPGVMGISDAAGVWGDSNTWHGVVGLSKSTTGGHGVYGKNMAGGTGVAGESDGWMGVYGKSKSTTGGAGVMGEGDPGPGVIGKSTKWIGVYGETAGIENGPAGVWGEHKGTGVGVKAVSKDGAGLAAYSTNSEAIHAETKSPGTAAIAAYNLNPSGSGAAIYGEHMGIGTGVMAKSKDGAGLAAYSTNSEAIHAETRSPGTAAIAAYNLNPSGSGAAIYGEHILGVDGTAAFFRGNVIVTGDISFPGADFAEDFTIKDEAFAEPGTVMALNCTGELVPCVDAYEKKVVGVVAGAGSHRTAIIMDRQEKSAVRRQPIALVGKVFCKVDASYGPIEVGDFLTSSATHGHAMKASNPTLAFGSVIGKAMATLDEGRGLIPILISLQ